MKNYRLRFDPWSLLLFLLIMIPTFIWFAIPAPNDILRADSVTETLDTAASICQVLMILILCFFRNLECKKIGISPFTIATIICCLLYFASWAVYYIGTVNTVVILGLTIPPCLAFLFFAIDRKNKMAIIPIFIFTICHTIYGIVNYII
ncbi:MAG: hypothetical protein NC417_01710 [Candidatus Gastranaerophilales bacterium]|nr:hypothetical protein [Candidatus Gastranaerophilales bacterium]